MTEEWIGTPAWKASKIQETNILTSLVYSIWNEKHALQSISDPSPPPRSTLLLPLSHVQSVSADQSSQLIFEYRSSFLVYFNSAERDNISIYNFRIVYLHSQWTMKKKSILPNLIPSPLLNLNRWPPPNLTLNPPKRLEISTIAASLTYILDKVMELYVLQHADFLKHA